MLLFSASGEAAVRAWCHIFLKKMHIYYSKFAVETFEIMKGGKKEAVERAVRLERDLSFHEMKFEHAESSSRVSWSERS